MGALDGRVAIVTGAGRGIGREHALLLASEGAAVVVNDLGGARDGGGGDPGPAESVVAEIEAIGGKAIASSDDVADWEGSKSLIDTTLDSFGGLDVLVNNAGIIRDRMIVNMSMEEWDDVIRVHLRGHFALLRHAASFWRAQAKAGKLVQASVVNTSSTSGLFGNIGQANYGAAKMGIAALTLIADAELARYGVRVNAIAPLARTRMTEDLGGQSSKPPTAGEFDERSPANIAPWVAYLACAECPIKGRIFLVHGGQVQLFQPFTIVDTLKKQGRWTLEELLMAGPRFGEVEFDLGSPFASL